MGEFERALRESAELVDRARAAGALGMLAQPLHIMADAAYRLGDWATADAATGKLSRSRRRPAST